MHTLTSFFIIIYNLSCIYELTQLPLHPCSVSQPNVYKYVTTKSITTGGHGCSVEKSASNNNNPAHDEGIHFTDQTIKAGNDAQYEIVNTQSRQITTDDIKLVKNPAYAETTFT